MSSPEFSSTSPASTPQTFGLGDSVTVVPPHNLGSYYDNLPQLSARERIQKYSTDRYMSKISRVLLQKYSPTPQSLQTSSSTSTLSETATKKNDSVIKGLKSGLTGQNNPGGIWKDIEDERERKWVKVYEDRVGKIYEKHRCRVEGGKKKEVAVESLEKFAVGDLRLLELNEAERLQKEKDTRTVSAFNEGKQIDFKLSTEGKSKYNGADFTPKFIKPRRLPTGSKRNKFCEACGLNCSVDGGGDLGCSYCSAVYHQSCLDPSFSLPKRPTDFVCPDCVDEIDYSKRHYEKEKLTIYEEHLEKHYATMIVSKWRGMVAKSRYVTMKRFLIRLQAMARAFKLRHSFMQTRRSMPRPLRVHLNRAINLPVADYDNQRADPYVIMTVIDEKDKQIWRFDSDAVYDDRNPTFDEDFVIPGCPGTSRLVLTVVDRDELRDQCLGQCFLHLSPRPTVETWKTGGVFRLALDEVYHMPKTASGSDMRMDFDSIIPQGFIEITLEPMEGMTNTCGFLMGPPLDDENIGAGFAKTDIKKSRRCWCMLAEHKLYIYSVFGQPMARLTLDLKSCQYDVGMGPGEVKNGFKIIAKNGSEYNFYCLKNDERDRWRSAFDCSFDLFVNKRDPNSSDRIGAAIELMKRKNVTAKNQKKPRKSRGVRSTKNDRGTAGRKSGMQGVSDAIKKEMEDEVGWIEGVPVGDNDAFGEPGMEPPTPLSHPSKRNKKSNLNKTTKQLSGKQFRDHKKKVAEEEAERERVRKEEKKARGEPPTPKNASKAKEVEIPDELKPKPRARVKLPGLQRKTSSTSSALFGHVEIRPNAPDQQEFKFSKTRRGSKAGLDAAMAAVEEGSVD
ncbi:hypothetical protein TrLO_g4218 [Triparma laevis f. longispina]|uniref:Uncharacterized protein n=1 Tax=Triparma laevis f. longispina TaxID=1714387 RepID=A0A9W7FKM3_9STRA|nr:hypothetical protein TrLO_g4218 [Triparma laevis f. longispina]